MEGQEEEVQEAKDGEENDNLKEEESPIEEEKILNLVEEAIVEEGP